MYTVDFNKPANIYFIGIGGSSMSGLAEIMLKKRLPRKWSPILPKIHQ